MQQTRTGRSTEGGKHLDGTIPREFHRGALPQLRGDFSFASRYFTHPAQNGASQAEPGGGNFGDVETGSVVDDVAGKGLNLVAAPLHGELQASLGGSSGMFGTVTHRFFEGLHKGVQHRLRRQTPAGPAPGGDHTVLDPAFSFPAPRPRQVHPRNLQFKSVVLGLGSQNVGGAVHAQFNELADVVQILDLGGGIGGNLRE